MKKSLTISEIAQILNVSAPTLRFWEEKGLFKVSKSDNLYRQYTFGDLIHIADIIFYRNLGISISKLKFFDSLTLSQYDETLEDAKVKLEKQIQDYNTMYSRVLSKKNALQEIVNLEKLGSSFRYEDIPFNNVVSFDYTEKEKVRSYTKDTSLYVRYFDTKDMESEARGIIVDTSNVKDKLLWQKKDYRRYATFLIKEKVDQGYLSDISEMLSKVKETHQTGILLARYLLTATVNGDRVDYLKAYAEILE